MKRQTSDGSPSSKNIRCNVVSSPVMPKQDCRRVPIPIDTHVSVTGIARMVAFDQLSRSPAQPDSGSQKYWLLRGAASRYTAAKPHFVSSVWSVSFMWLV